MMDITFANNVAKYMNKKNGHVGVEVALECSQYGRHVGSKHSYDILMLNVVPRLLRL